MNNIMNKKNELFHTIHPSLRENFLQLCRNGKIGLKSVSMNNITTSQRKLIDDKYAYNFRIQIPYAGKFLSWDILFDPNDLEFAPDFDVPDDYFPIDIDEDEITEKIPSLTNWNIENSNSLEVFLRELLDLFKHYQIEELKNRMHEEYQFLLTALDITPDEVEVLIDTNNVHFLISIKVRLSDLPEYIQQIDENQSYLNPKEDFALLYVNFQKSDTGKVSTQLQLSPRLEQLIGNSRNLHIPTYNREETLAQYVTQISKLLQNQIDRVAYNCQFRKEFITSLVTLRSNSIVEYDSYKFDKIAFLCEVDNFHTLVQVTIGDDFPKEKPKVKLYSLYCTNAKTKTPCERAVEFRQFPNKPADEVAKVFLNYLKGAVENFEMHHVP